MAGVHSGSTAVHNGQRYAGIWVRDAEWSDNSNRSTCWRDALRSAATWELRMSPVDPLQTFVFPESSHPESKERTCGKSEVETLPGTVDLLRCAEPH
jgi:hypothetical protein